MQRSSEIQMTGVGSDGIETTNLQLHAAASIDHGLKVVEIVALRPSHPFTNFDKWRLI
jgi:hypothetical protein